MSRFEPDSYRQYRVHYPEALFQPLRPLLGPISSRPIRVLDLGAGTGNSAASFSIAYPGEIEFTLVDPDPKMLGAIDLSLFSSRVQFTKVSAESHEIPFEESSSPFKAEISFDLALIGSAWHWMNASATLDRLIQVLRPGGGVFVFEYQFPKAVGEASSGSLNEWIRREFNLRWKESNQKPRGSLRELTESFRRHFDFSEYARCECKAGAALSARDFQGVITSQSRYLAYERGLLDEGARQESRDGLLDRLEPFWNGHSDLKFEYGYEGFLFRRRHL